MEEQKKTQKTRKKSREEVLTAVFSTDTKTAATELLGINRSTFDAYWEEYGIQEEVDRWHEEQWEKAQKILQDALPKAAANYEEKLGNRDPRISLQASDSIFEKAKKKAEDTQKIKSFSINFE